MRRILLLGHSHIANLQQAYQERGGKLPGLLIEFAPISSPNYSPNLEGDRLHPAIAAILGKPRFDAVVSCIGGNAHFSLGLVNHPRRYDFVLPAEPDLPLQEGAEILPYGLMLLRLEQMAHETTPVLPAVKAATTRPMFHLESPPPVPSAAHITAHAKHFAPLIAHYGVSRPERAYRFWRLQSQMMQNICTAQGISFVPAPAAMLDAQGMLKPEAWRDDPTHAGPAYGHAVLDQLCALLSPSESLA